MNTNELNENYPLANMQPLVSSAPDWIGHVPFAFALIETLKPRTIVELGTYSGSSFFAFCQAVKKLGIDTDCYGVDMWEGDIHMGEFEDSLYMNVLEYKDKHYPSAVFIRKFFDDAVNEFEDGTIDLLHIDETHTYEAVSNDFNTWLPKMSTRGVVLFHDTNVTYDDVGKQVEDFGVKEFFNETKKNYPHLEFNHSYGLGVVAVGAEPSKDFLDMVEASHNFEFIRYFEKLGNSVSRRYEKNLGLFAYYMRYIIKMIKNMLIKLGLFEIVKNAIKK